MISEYVHYTAFEINYSFPSIETNAKPPLQIKTSEGRWRSFTYDELMARDKVNLDIFWLCNESLEDSANPPEPDVLASEIMENLKSALAQFESIAKELGEIG